jgi:hypothetical protein
MLTYTVITLNQPRHSTEPSLFCSPPQNPVAVSPLPAALTNSLFPQLLCLDTLTKARGASPPRDPMGPKMNHDRTKISRKERGARLLPKRQPETLVSAAYAAYAAIACGNPLIMLISQFLSERRPTRPHTRVGPGCGVDVFRG